MEGKGMHNKAHLQFSQLTLKTTGVQWNVYPVHQAKKSAYWFRKNSLISGTGKLWKPIQRSLSSVFKASERFRSAGKAFSE